MRNLPGPWIHTASYKVHLKKILVLTFRPDSGLEPTVLVVLGMLLGRRRSLLACKMGAEHLVESAQWLQIEWYGGRLAAGEAKRKEWVFTVLCFEALETRIFYFKNRKIQQQNKNTYVRVLYQNK